MILFLVRKDSPPFISLFPSLSFVDIALCALIPLLYLYCILLVSFLLVMYRSCARFFFLNFSGWMFITKRQPPKGNERKEGRGTVKQKRSNLE